MDRYDIGRRIGQGSYGSVYLVRRKNDMQVRLRYSCRRGGVQWRRRLGDSCARAGEHTFNLHLSTLSTHPDLSLAPFLPQVFVLKEMSIEGVSQKEREAFATEVRLLADLEHPCIVGYVESFVEPSSNSFCIVMAYCQGGDLAKYIKTRKSKLAGAPHAPHSLACHPSPVPLY